MEQLITQTHAIEISKKAVVDLTTKIEVSLTMMQLESLYRLLLSWSGKTLSERNDLSDKALLFVIFKLCEKLRIRCLSLSPKAKIKLDMAQAWAVFEVLDSFDLSAWSWEDNIKRQVIEQILQQTV